MAYVEGLAFMALLLQHTKNFKQRALNDTISLDHTSANEDEKQELLVYFSYSEMQKSTNSASRVIQDGVE